MVSAAIFDAMSRSAVTERTAYVSTGLRRTAKSWELRKDVLRPPLFSPCRAPKPVSAAPFRHPPSMSSALSPASEETRLLLLGLRLRGRCLRLGRRRSFLHCCRRLRCRQLLCRCSLGLGRRCLLRCRLRRSLCSRFLGRCCLRLGGRSLGRCCLLHRRFCGGFRSRLLGWCCLGLGRGGLRLGRRCRFLHCGSGLRRRRFYWCFLCR